MGAIFTCSIDDGHPSDMKMANLLHKHGLKGTFYIPLKNREGLPVMSLAQIRELDRSFEIGSHTYDHCYLGRVDLKEAKDQVVDGKHRLEDVLGHAVEGFCYPGGKYSGKHVSLVRNAGFKYARTTKNLCLDAGDQPFEMPTTIQFYPHRKSVYFRNFVKGGNWPARLKGLSAVLRQDDWIKRLYALFDQACQQNAVFHLWCHSHDIDTLATWEEMDSFLGYASSKVTNSNRLTNRQLAYRSY